MSNDKPYSRTQYIAAESYRVKLLVRTIEEWISEYCIDGDELNVIFTDHIVSLQNKRTKMIYFMDTEK